jgi:hypothetical protein
MINKDSVSAVRKLTLSEMATVELDGSPGMEES